MNANYFDNEDPENPHETHEIITGNFAHCSSESKTISLHNRLDRSRFANPTIVFCNPNGGLYELMCYDVSQAILQHKNLTITFSLNGLSFMSAKG